MSQRRARARSEHGVGRVFTVDPRSRRGRFEDDRGGDERWSYIEMDQRGHSDETPVTRWSIWQSRALSISRSTMTIPSFFASPPALLCPLCLSLHHTRTDHATMLTHPLRTHSLCPNLRHPRRCPDRCHQASHRSRRRRPVRHRRPPPHPQRPGRPIRGHPDRPRGWKVGARGRSALGREHL